SAPTRRYVHRKHRQHICEGTLLPFGFAPNYPCTEKECSVCSFGPSTERLSIVCPRAINTNLRPGNAFVNLTLVTVRKIGSIWRRIFRVLQSIKKVSSRPSPA